MLGCAAKRVLLADHSKFGVVKGTKHGDLDDIDILITDTGLDRWPLRAIAHRRNRSGASMIVTLTPNPSVDRTVFLDDVVLGSVNRSQRSWSEPSGKGVNVALALHAHDVPVRAVVTAGGPVGAQLQQMLDSAGLDTVVVPIAGEIRSNISLTQPNGSVTKINEAGPSLSRRGDRSTTARCRRTGRAAHAGWSAQAACPPAYPSTGTAKWSNSDTEAVCLSPSTPPGKRWPKASRRSQIW